MDVFLSWIDFKLSWVFKGFYQERQNLYDSTGVRRSNAFETNDREMWDRGWFDVDICNSNIPTLIQFKL